MNLKSKKNEALLSELKTLAHKEREIQTEILHYLREVESRMLHLEMGYPSLHEFAMQEFCYSGGAAHRRIQAMKLLKTFPEMEEKIKTGELSLHNAAQVQSHFYQRREEPIPMEAKREIVQSVLGTSSRECERKLLELIPEANRKTTIQFEASPELLEKLEKLKALLAHEGMDHLIEKLADLALKKLEPKVDAHRDFPALETDEVPKSRYIPRAVRRAVWTRDGGKCTFRDPKTGRVCGSQYAIQFDHLFAYSLGGSHAV